MRKTRLGLVFTAALLAAGQAHAQFANKHIGFELGAIKFTDRELKVGLAAQLEGNIYIENGFDVGLRVPFVLFLTTVANRQRFGVGGQLYVRYLFSEESFRPWASLELDVLGIVRENDASISNGQQQVFWGPGASAGLDYFVGDSVSLGARGFFTLYIALNNDQPIRPGYGGFGNVKFYF
jgi:outer membrane protein